MVRVQESDVGPFQPEAACGAQPAKVHGAPCSEGAACRWPSVGSHGVKTK